MKISAMTVAEYVVKFLEEHGVRHVFGYPGGAVLKIIDALAANKNIEYVQNYHEQASSFCADAYSRVSGNIGVALATSGPGATNLITGIANAQLDSIPVLFITGQEFSSRIKKNEEVRSHGFQDLDIVSVVKPITKYSTIIMDCKKIAYELEKAFFIAKSGRPGAVLIDIPIDVQFELIDTERLVHFEIPEDCIPNVDTDVVSKFINMVTSAKRPVILGGGGINIAGAHNEFNDFVKKTNIPVVLTLNGLDVYKDYYGFSGLYGNTWANLAVYHADLLIVLGARLGQHQVGKLKSEYSNAKVIHVDIDSFELGRALLEDLSIQANLNIFLSQINAALKDKTMPIFKEWHLKLDLWRLAYLAEDVEENKCKGEDLSPIHLIQEATKFLDENAVVTADVGQNQMWVAQAFRPSGSQRLLNSSGLGSMGYGLPAAIAAKICMPKASVVAFMGDGGFQINMQELQFITLHKLDIKIFVFNNGVLGLIKSSQDKYFEGRSAGCEYPNFGCPNLKIISEAYQLGYYKIASKSDMSNLEIAMLTTGPVLIEVAVSPYAVLNTRSSHVLMDEFVER